MATVSTVPNDFVPTAASNVNASVGLRYDSILADACAFNRRLRKGRINRPDFFDSATQIPQRSAPWLHRSVQARTKSLSLTRSHLLVTYRRHRWRIQPGFKRKFAESLEHSHLLFMFQTISFPSSNVGIDTSNARGSLTRPQTATTEFTKLPQPSQSTLGISTTDPEASLPGSVSNEGSCQSSATPTSINNSTTASNGGGGGGGDRRISTSEMQQQSGKQPQTSPSAEDYAGQRYDSYAGRYGDEEDPERTKLKFRRRIMGINADKTGVIRRYHRRIGGGVVGRVSKIVELLVLISYYKFLFCTNQSIRLNRRACFYHLTF
ncbi:unnamed protein product [Rodentolepis nana]|uniref:BHLH domain-containing protein n=1 Tax=Rodentolepis nana TaxID=102285 RepID=A0A0R3T1G3_RODNA|nr:unnamed protein product [Rodentolepis nana]